MATTLVDIFKTARPRQWIKNFTLYAGLVFTGNVLTNAQWLAYFWVVSEAVMVFTLVAISIYFLNDLIDIKADQAHPFKRKRPIAAGKISPRGVMLIFIASAATGLGWALALNKLFFAILLGYWILQILYSVKLKHIEVVDVFVIAVGFFLRVFAGAIVVNLHLSIWFLLCVMAVSLFLAVGKRRGELAILTEQVSALQHRKVMGKYTPAILDAYLSMFATTSFLSWALYTFNFYEQSGVASSTFLWQLSSRTLTINKWLMVTIPVVIFGIMRYIRIIYDGSRAESPERVILNDKPLLASVVIWGLIVITVLYLAPS